MISSNPQSIATLPEIKELQDVSCWLAQRGWAEAGSGNISYRLETVPDIDITPEETIVKDMPFMAPQLRGTHLLITTSGSRMREMFSNVDENICLIRIGKLGKQYSILYGTKEMSSELPTHLMVHAMLMKHRPEFRAVLHTQPPRIIGLTHLPEFRESKRLVDILFRMHPETRVLFPEKIGVVSFHVPGSNELGQRTARLLKEHRLVIWNMHGVVSIGRNLAEALDHVELIEKAAEIYWTVRTMGVEPEGMTNEQISETLSFFGINH